MNPREFAQPYNHHPEKKYISDSPEAVKKLVAPFEVWSKYFGDELYSLMAEAHPDDRNPDGTERTLLKTYVQHTKAQNAEAALPNIEQTILSDVSIPEQDRHALMYRFSMAHNFHRMSQVMITSWAEMIWGLEPSKADRSFGIDVSMFCLAFSALKYARWRQQQTHILNNHRYFSEELSDGRAHGTGIMAELDTGIILLAISRDDPNIIVVPAPRRFEDTDDRFNVDFIVYDKSTDEIAGVQAKTKVHQDDIDRYDPARVLLVDAEKDLGGKAWTRTEAGKSVTKPVAWPGMVARDYMQSLKLHGNKHAATQLYNPHFLLNLKAEASHRLVPQYDNAVKPIGIQTAKRTVKEKLFPMLGR
ncbi:MAG TPA: hypothetical protein VGE34_00940 [Candidatus Saccharimonadales bacterium]